MSKEQVVGFDPIAIYRSSKKEGIRPDVCLREAGYKGMGVFATRKFSVGDVIEMSHGIILGWQSRYHGDPAIGQYAYALGCHCNPSPERPPCLLNCPANGTRYFIPLGYGACYNSADSEDQANARYHLVPEEKMIFFVAVKEIFESEEVLTWFGAGYYQSWCKPFIPSKRSKQ